MLAALPARLRPPTDEGLERLLVAGLLGGAAGGTVLFALAGLGLLRAPVLAGLGATVLVAAAARGLPARPVATMRVAATGPYIALAAALIPVALHTLYPSTGFDAGTYHLPTARAMAESGGLVVLPMLRFPLFPQAAEILFAAGRTLGGGEVVARCLQLAHLLATAALTFAWGRRRAPRVGAWTAALWLGTPLAVWIGTRAYVDVQLACYATASLWALERARELPQQRPADGWWLLAGATAGAAAATKYLGLYFVGVVVVSALMASRRRRTTVPALAAGGAALLVAGPWFARLVACTGNPFFPFYQGLFGANAWSSAHDRSLHALLDTHSPFALVGESLGFLLATPWRALAAREVFDFQAPLSPWLLVLPPVLGTLALLRRLPGQRLSGRSDGQTATPVWAGPELRCLLAIAGYLVLWLTTVRDLRFLLPCLPAIALLLATASDRLFPPRSDVPRSMATLALTVALLLPGPLYAIHKLYEAGPLPLSATARLDYLDRRLPGHAALRHLDTAHAPGYVVFGLDSEQLTAHARRGRHIGALFGPAAVGPVRRAPTGAALAERLRAVEACFLLVPQHGLVRQHSPGASFGTPSADGAVEGPRSSRIAQRPGFARRFRVDQRGAGWVLYALVDPSCPPPVAH
ncbi:MAG: glycosyltransferase family 39 protein [Acidobacteriota bacterium]